MQPKTARAWEQGTSQRLLPSMKTCIYAPHFKNFIPLLHIKVNHVVLSNFVDCHHAHIEREFGLTFDEVENLSSLDLLWSLFAL